MDAAIGGEGGVGRGVKNAFESVGGGFASGVTGIFSAPVKGARTEGFGGFVKGVGKGLVGAVVKPVMGVTEGVTAVVQGASNATDGKIVKHTYKRPRRAIPLNPRTGSMVVVAYSESAANAQARLVEGAKVRDTEDGGASTGSVRGPDAYVGHVSLPHPDSGAWQLVVMVSLKKLVMLACPSSNRDKHNRGQFLFGARGSMTQTYKPLMGKRLDHISAPLSGSRSTTDRVKELDMAHKWSQVAHCLPAHEGNVLGVYVTFYIDIASNLFLSRPNCQSGRSKKTIFLSCADRENQRALYGLLLTRRNVMGDGRSMPNHIDHGSGDESHESGAGVNGEVSNASTGQNSVSSSTAHHAKSWYRFGAANENGDEAFLKSNREYLSRCTETSVVLDLKRDLEQIRSGSAQAYTLIDDTTRGALDVAMWSFVRTFLATHRPPLGNKRVVVLLLLNESTHAVQIDEPHLRVGESVHLVSSSSNFDPAYRTMAPGGALAMVCWSFGPMPFRKMHAHAQLETSAVSIGVSDMRSKTTARPKQGFAAGVLENNTSSDKSWTKLVVSVTTR